MASSRCPHCGIEHEPGLTICPMTGLSLRAVERARAPSRVEEPEPPPATPDLLGATLAGRYRVQELLGEGGMGMVYGAADMQAGVPVAIKVLLPKHRARAEVIARLDQEARVASSIKHPSICAIIDTGSAPDGRPFVVMERLYGESLADRLKRETKVQYGELCRFMVGVLGALEATHQHGIIHRDLKPDNIYLEVLANGAVRAKVLDFGVSKAQTRAADDLVLTEVGMVMGTPYYMAPEQARGERSIDHRVDVWAAGVILYEALSGRRPFLARNYNALLVQILTAKPRALGELVPGLPSELAQVVERALAKHPNDRPLTAGAMARDLAPFAERETAAWEDDSHSSVSVETWPEDEDDATSVFKRGDVQAAIAQARGASAPAQPTGPAQPTAQGAQSQAPSQTQGRTRGQVQSQARGQAQGQGQSPVQSPAQSPAQSPVHGRAAGPRPQVEPGGDGSVELPAGLRVPIPMSSDGPSFGPSFRSGSRAGVGRVPSDRPQPPPHAPPSSSWATTMPMPARGGFDLEEDVERTVVDPPSFSTDLPPEPFSPEPFDEPTVAEPATRKP